MRERLVAAFIGMTVAMIVMYGVPRAYVLANLVHDQEQSTIDRSATLLAAVLTERIQDEAAVTEKFLSTFLLDRTSITYVSPEGDTVQAGTLPEAEDQLVQTRDLRGGGSVTLARSNAVVNELTSSALMPLILFGLGLIAFAAFVGFFLARRLARPFGELAVAAERLGRAQFDIALPRYTIPEADAIGNALSQASTQLDTLLRREREFAANASHQLRTPITALRLTLEDLTMWPETPRPVADELNANIGELDRLSTAITELLDLSRGNLLDNAVDVDLTELVAASISRWRAHVEDLGRVLVHDPIEPVPAHVAPGPVLQVLDVLIENAGSHGSGQITVGAHRRGAFLEIIVADEGTAGIDSDLFHRGTRSTQSDGHGLGLGIATELAASAGGRLTVADTDTDTTAFVLLLPATNA